MATARKKPTNGGRVSAVKKAAGRVVATLRGDGWKRVGIVFLLSVLMALMMAEYRRAQVVKLTLGEIAERDVEAWSDFKVPNYHLTSEAQRNAENTTRPVFNYDELVVDELLRRIDRAFHEVQQALAESAPAADVAEGGVEVVEGAEAPVDAAPEQTSVQEQHIDAFEAELGVTLTEIDRATLATQGFDDNLRDMVMTLTERTMSRMIIGSPETLPADEQQGISLVRIRGAERSEEVLYSFADLLTLQEARAWMSTLAREQFDQQAPYVLGCAVNLSHSILRPNLTFDASETQVRRDQARLAVGIIYNEFKDKQVILRKGEMVTQESIDALAEMEKFRGGYRLWSNVVALTLFILLFISSTYLFASRFVTKFATSVKDAAALAVLAGLAVVLCKVGEMMASALSEAFPVVPETSYYFAIPVAATAVMVRILMNSETAVVFASVVSVACAYVLGADLMLAAYFFIGSVASAGALAHAKQRGKVFRAGLVTSLVNVAMVVCLTLIRLSVFGVMAEEAPIAPLWDIGFALLGGLTVGIIALGLVPVFEAAGFLTDIKLLELASLDHPLLREMVIKAPGTYHHSVLVGSLAEAGAEAISANALLARVGAYFHDIGKTLKPNYFVENQQDASNVHDRLSPSMSSLIIINHVKEGIELGRQNHLPREILDIIPQHHGTSLIRFFFTKAKEGAEESGKAHVNEEDYRYPGPKPRTRESGIVMLADSVEAATRSLKEPTRHNITIRVQQVINSVVLDGQLDHCPLTLKDLSIVAETFTSVLVGIHHHRVEYPDAKDAGSGKGQGGPKSQSVSKGGGKSLTLELPPMQSHPELPHPLDKEARAAAEEALRSSEPGTISETTLVKENPKAKDITTSGDSKPGTGDNGAGRPATGNKRQGEKKAKPNERA